MATYYTNSSNQRDAVSMLCLREPLPNSYPERPILSNNMSLYMNSGSYSDALSGNSQQPNTCFAIASIDASHSTSEQQEILANLGGLQTGDHDLSAWREGRNEMLVTHPVDGQNLHGQGLSLSLGTQIPAIHDQNADPNFDSVLGPNHLISGDGGYRSSSSRDEHLRHTVILPASLPEGNQDMNRGDFSMLGMSSVARTIPNSKYLKVAQQLLDELVDLRKAIKRPDISKKYSKEDDGMLENERAPANGLLSSQDSFGNASCELPHAENQDLRNKLTKLLSMLDEVDSRYKQYYHQMQIVVSSFDVTAGHGAAKSYTALALQTISRHFRCLHDAITGQIRATQKNLGEQDASGNNKSVGISRLRFVDQQLQQQRALQQLGMVQPAWRPQRGLPESSVSILRAWLFEHFLHPYPKDSEKIMLARQTGLTRSQISNWFINARVRLWKPMIEKMHKEEFGDADIDSSSSSENASKMTKSDAKISTDIGDGFQHCQSTMDNKNCNTEQAKDFGSDHVPDTKTVEPHRIVSLHNRGLSDEPEYGLVKQTREQRPNFDDCGLFPDDTSNDRLASVASTCQIPEFGRFETGNGVSLTLGLQHCEGGNFMSGETHYSFVAMREDDIYNAAGAVASAGAVSSVGAEAAGLDCMSAGNQQQRYNSPHLVHDFVV